jgi:arsenate reductase (thioredoxin)
MSLYSKIKEEKMNRIKVLFLCTGNSARSQIAEGFLRKLGGNRFEVFSAGLEPKGIHPLTLKVMEEEGIDMVNQRSKHLDEYMGKIHFSYVITVCGNADKNCPAVFPGAGMRIHWDFNDPAAYDGSADEKIGKFREVRDKIRERIILWLDEIRMPSSQ